MLRITTIFDRLAFTICAGQSERVCPDYDPGLLLKLIKTEPTPENLELLAEIYTQQGLYNDAAVLYLRVVKAGLRNDWQLCDEHEN